MPLVQRRAKQDEARTPRRNRPQELLPVDNQDRHRHHEHDQATQQRAQSVPSLPAAGSQHGNSGQQEADTRYRRGQSDCGTEDRWRQRILSLGLGRVELADGNIDRAETLLTENVGLHEAIGNPLYVPWSLEGLAGVAAARGEWQRVAYLSGARDALRQRSGFPLSPLGRQAYTTTLEAARAALPDDGFRAAYDAGWLRPEHAATPNPAPR